jgi:tetratricopeptide (TPR) repeat protein
MATSLWRYWAVRGYLTEGREWLSRALANSLEHTLIRGKALGGAGTLASLQNDHDAARLLYQEALAIYEELGDRLGISTALLQLGTGAYDEGNHDSARSLFEQSLEIKRELDDRLGTGMLLNNLGIIAQEQGDYSIAKSLFEQSLEIKRQLGDRLGEAISLHCLARVACQQANYANALTLCQESLEIESELQDKLGIADCLEGLAEVACRMKKPNQAARLLGASEIVRETYGIPIFSIQRGHYEGVVAEIRGLLTPKQFDAAWMEGREMSFEEAVAYALRRQEYESDSSS